MNIEPMQVDEMDNDPGIVGSGTGAGHLDSGSPDLLDSRSAVPTDGPSSDFTVPTSTIDLDLYVTQYSDLYRIQRLLFVAQHCPSIQLEALRLALRFIITTNNTLHYRKAHQMIATYQSEHADWSDLPANQQKECVFNQSWLDEAKRVSNARFEKLDSDLRSYRSNSIKESIRRGHSDMGKHFLDTGELHSALKSFIRARDYCTSSKHVLEMCFNVIGVNVLLKNWFHVQNFVAKAEQTSEINDSGGSKKAQAKVCWLKCANGLAELAFAQYKNAAKAFTGVSLDNCPGDFISPPNIALYGGLCALASYDRSELHKNVLQNANFKQILEVEPQMREIISSFHNSNYATCFSMIEDCKNNWLLDIYLSSHVNNLCKLIRKRALCQYFSPYSSVDMAKMADGFNTGVDGLQEELAGLIQNDMLAARIDSHNKVLYAREENKQIATFENALGLGTEFEKRSVALLARCAMIKAQVTVGVKTESNERAVEFLPPF